MCVWVCVGGVCVCHNVTLSAVLTTRQHLRDNVTMFSGPKMVDYWIIFIYCICGGYSIKTPRLQHVSYFGYH